MTQKDISNYANHIRQVYGLEPRKRSALDGKTWWCIYDVNAHGWSTDTRFGRYYTRKAAVVGMMATTVLTDK